MNCEAFERLLPAYPDAIEEETERTALLRHAASCPACAAKLAAQEAMLGALNTLDDALELPEAFSDGWRQRLHEAPKRQRPWFRRWKGVAAAAAALVVLIGGTVLVRQGILFPQAAREMMADDMAWQTGYGMVDEVSGVPSANYVAKRMADVPEPMAMEAESAAYDDTAAAPSEAASQARIVIRSASLSLRSEQYDADLEAVTAMIRSAGGWVEEESTYGEPLAQSPDGGRNTYLRVRIPDGALDGFIESIAALNGVANLQRSAEDISDQYYDTEGRLTMYEAQRDRLTELLAQAQDMSDIIEIDARLSEVQYSIESMTGRLRGWDSRASNAMVTVSISEVARAQAHVRLPLGQRLIDAFGNSIMGLRAFLADMMVVLVLIAPYLIATIVVVGIVYCIYRAATRKKRKDDIV